MNTVEQNRITANRILFELGLNMQKLFNRAYELDGTTLIFKLNLIGCQTESDVKNLIKSYL